MKFKFLPITNADENQKLKGLAKLRNLFSSRASSSGVLAIPDEDSLIREIARRIQLKLGNETSDRFIASLKLRNSGLSETNRMAALRETLVELVRSGF